MIRANPRLAKVICHYHLSGLWGDQSLAKKLGISVGYLKHLMRGGRPVHVSTCLGLKMIGVMKICESDFWDLVRDQNARTQRYYQRFKKAPRKPHVSRTRAL
jgi:hypothetical protein